MAATPLPHAPAVAARPAAGAGLAWRVAAAVLVAVYAVVLLRTAWLSDDAYITLRVVDNLTHGHGLRWNAAERVQVNVHPLWTLLLAGLHALTGENYFTALGLSLALSLGTVVLVAFALARTPAQAALAVGALLLSRAFVDYSTSGLENPLTNALLVGLLLAQERRAARPWARLAGIALLAALVVLARLDAALLVAPLVVVEARALRLSRSLGALALGALPLVAWLVFATLYFGTPVPNVAYGKTLAIGVPRGELLAHGLAYFAHSLREDPLTLPALALATAAAVVADRRRNLPVAAGIALALGWVLWVGGDPMGGRFCATPLLLGVAAFVRAPLCVRSAPALAAAGAALGLGVGLCPAPTVLAGADYGDLVIGADGIADERAFYYQRYGLLSPGREIPPRAVVTAELRRSGVGGRTLAVTDFVGVVGFMGGPAVHIVDPILCDPLLARLPGADFAEGWRIGHVRRRIPEGYLETLVAGENQIRDPALARYWDALARLTRAPLLDRERLRTIPRFLVGAGSRDLASFVRGEYRSPPVLRVAHDDVRGPCVPGSAPWAPSNELIYAGGLEVDLGEPRRAARLRLCLDGRDLYRLDFLRAGRVVARSVLAIDAHGPVGMQTGEIDVPPAAVEAGYDAVRLVPERSTDRIYALGGLELSDS